MDFLQCADGQGQPADDHRHAAERHDRAEPVPRRPGERQHFQQAAEDRMTPTRNAQAANRHQAVARCCSARPVNDQRQRVQHLVANGRFEDVEAAVEIVAGVAQVRQEIWQAMCAKCAERDANRAEQRRRWRSSVGRVRSSA